MTNPRPPIDAARDAIVEAARMHVIFDGWSRQTLSLAAKDADIAPEMVAAAFPRGPLDLAAAFHRAGDAKLEAWLREADLSELRYSEKVAEAVFQRLLIAAPDREAVRRATAFFALPQNAGTGAQLIWKTADTIWTGLGDTSDDLNWYSKRAILTGVYSASTLYWLGDDSDDFARTRTFIDRRIADVMSFEKTKARVQSTRAWEMFRQGPGRILDAIKAPGQGAANMPGRWPGR